MQKDELINKLSELVQLDIDAVHSYDQAMDHIKEDTIRTELSRFQEDHEKHITSLSIVLRDLGAEPPEYSPDFKGYLITGFTSLRSASGTEGALKAMQSNEKLTNKKYQEAGSWNTDEALSLKLNDFLEDERRHLSYVEEALDRKIWELEKEKA